MGQIRIILRNNGGFSLIELTLVIAVMAIALVVVVSNIDAVIPATRINSEARKLSTFIETSFSHSVATGRPVAIVYDINEQAYFMAFPQADADEDPYLVEHDQLKYLPSSIHISKVYKGDISEMSGIVTIYISPNGRMKGHSIFLRDEDDRKLTIEVMPLTGAASIYDGYVEPRSLEEDSDEQQ